MDRAKVLIGAGHVLKANADAADAAGVGQTHGLAQHAGQAVPVRAQALGDMQVRDGQADIDRVDAQARSPVHVHRAAGGPDAQIAGHSPAAQSLHQFIQPFLSHPSDLYFFHAHVRDATGDLGPCIRWDAGPEHLRPFPECRVDEHACALDFFASFLPCLQSMSLHGRCHESKLLYYAEFYCFVLDSHECAAGLTRVLSPTFLSLWFV
jgi:hypothetical protein